MRSQICCRETVSCTLNYKDYDVYKYTRACPDIKSLYVQHLRNIPCLEHVNLRLRCHFHLIYAKVLQCGTVVVFTCRYYHIANGEISSTVTCQALEVELLGFDDRSEVKVTETIQAMSVYLVKVKVKND